MDAQALVAFFLFCIVFVVGIFVMRGIGAWMLRIDDVIKILKEIRDQNKPDKEVS